jgi:O-antigen ligase
MIAGTRGAKQQRRNLILLLGGFAVITLGLAFTPAAIALVALVPAASAGIAFYLHRRHPEAYLGLLCWLFFLVPMLRRIIEMRSSSSVVSFVMIAPFFACWAGLAIYRHDWSGLFSARLSPWLAVAAAVAYGFLVGGLSNPKVAVIQDAFGWTSPMCVAFYLYAQREHASTLLDSFRSNMMYGLLVMSLYGLYQFFFLAPWDAAWMISSGLNSIGTPEPLSVRVFSTMNTPQPFADYLIAGLMLLAVSTRKLRIVTMPLAVIVLALTMSRSSWMAGAVGLAVLSIALTMRQRIQMVLLMIACVGAFALALQVPSINEIVVKRADSFKNLKEDGSLQDRIAAQQQAVVAFQDSPFGLGLGADGSHARTGPSYGVPQPIFNTGDNGWEQIFLSFGWFGSLVYILGLSASVIAALRIRSIPEITPLKAILVSIICEAPVMGVFPGATGFLIWTTIGLCFAFKYASVELPQASEAVPSEWRLALPRESA